MKVLELTLVKSQRTFSNIFDFVARQRYEINDDNEVMASVLKFIGSNMEIIASATKGNEISDHLRHAQSMNMDEFMSLRFFLSSKFGIDILMWCVAEAEVNPSSIGDGTYEYNVLDENYGTTGYTKLASKIIVPSETMNLAKVYDKIVDMYGLFEGPIFQGNDNVLKSDIQTLKEIESLTGELPTQITQHINSILEFTGKRLIVIS